MNKKKWIVAASVAMLCLLAVFYQPLIQAASTITWEGILPNIYTGTSGTEALNIAMTASTVGLDVSEESALTNTVQEVMSLTHTTSGTPANGIGLEWVATQETSASNNEDIGAVQFYMSDVTAASEDASFGIELMAAGAAKSEVLTVGSTGIVSLKGAATLDNTTSATNLNITETTVTITGNEVVTGSVDITGAAGLILSNDETITNAANGVISVDGTFDITAAGGLVLSNDETITNGTDGQVDIGGDTYLNGAIKYKTCTIADGDATPDVAGCHILTTSSNTAPTAITDLDNPVVGSIYIIVGGSATNSSTIADSGNFALSAAFTATVDETLTLYVQADNDYIELTRSTN